MPIWTGHRLVEPDDTPPAMTVSAASVGEANRSEAAITKAMILRAWTHQRTHPALLGTPLRVAWGCAGGTPAVPGPAITPLRDVPQRRATGRIPRFPRRWCAIRPHGGRCIRAPRRARRCDEVRR